MKLLIPGVIQQIKNLTSSAPVLTFTTNRSSGFVISVAASSGIAEWDLGDGTVVNSNEVTHDYTDTSEKTVTLKLGTIPSIDDINNLTMSACNIVGELNLTDWTRANGQLFIQNNPDLTNILFPTILEGSPSLSNLYVRNNALLTSLDISGLINLANTLAIRGNNLLSNIIFPAVIDGTVGIYDNWLIQNDLSGTVDLSGLIRLSNLNIYRNSNLTNVLLPNDRMYVFNANNCNLVNMDFSTCPNISNVDNHTHSVNNNGFTETQIDAYLTSYDTNSVAGFTGRVLNILTGNSAPSATGQAAITSLESKGFTVS
ncbi:MAG TPA: hypothetical protein VK982_16450 [Bacteroidales bacterium]|nr:hypothetical protein [Bacteroidales bacterium]